MRQVPGQLLKSGDYTHLAPGEGCRFHNECNGDVTPTIMCGTAGLKETTPPGIAIDFRGCVWNVRSRQNRDNMLPFSQW